jgi:hypothetical protein
VTPAIALVENSNATKTMEELLRQVTEPPYSTQLVVGNDGEQVLRAGVLKQLCGFNYEELAFHLADSSSYQTYCRLGSNQQPLTKPTLQRNLNRVKPETWEAVNQMLVHKAQELGIESGDRTYIPQIASAISSGFHPFDSRRMADFSPGGAPSSSAAVSRSQRARSCKASR